MKSNLPDREHQQNILLVHARGCYQSSARARRGQLEVTDHQTIKTIRSPSTRLHHIAFPTFRRNTVQGRSRHNWGRYKLSSSSLLALNPKAPTRSSSPTPDPFRLLTPEEAPVVLTVPEHKPQR